jgi:signal transduction histidine kinase
MGIGFGAVHYSVKKIKAAYIEQQLNLNKRTARNVSNLLAQQLSNDVPHEKVLDMFQKAILGNHVNEGYLCMFDQRTAKLLCHPNTDMIGVKVNNSAFQFDNMQLKDSQVLGEAVTSNNAEGGILRLEEPSRSEITYMVPVQGTSWKVSVHENTEKTEEKMQKFANTAYLGFILLSLLISVLATFMARRVSSSYEEKIEHQNHALSKKNKIQSAQKKKIKEQKATIEEHASHLEDKVKERTAALEKANKKLSHIEKAKSDFLGIISHELRTPLNGIIGFSDLLEQELAGSEHAESVKNIKSSGYRLMKFSETALLITELTSGNVSMDFNDYSIRKLINTSHENLKASLQEKELTLQTSLPEEEIMIPMVTELMEECVANILKNAIRYTPQGGKIYVNGYKKGHNFFCDIQDTGPGFSQEALDKLFEYFGADKVMNHTKGFGLGLSAAYLIMEAHGGKIEVENCDEGAWGARVRLVFPDII